jgi:hypothetical protein
MSLGFGGCTAVLTFGASTHALERRSISPYLTFGASTQVNFDLFHEPCPKFFHPKFNWDDLKDVPGV